MAIGWITAFRAIPWAEVIAAAPAVVQGARKLWSGVKAKQAETSATEPPGEAVTAGQPSIEARVRSLERRTAELRNEALSTSELIHSLAEQNARLVAAVETLRVRTRILLACCALLGLAVLGAILWLALR